MADTTAAASGPAALLSKLRGRTDIFFALGLIGILVILILPMPAFLLDMLLAISITFSVMIFMTAVFIQRPLDFSSFPTVLLVAALFRLSLNMASTRLILSEGHTGPAAAGGVIEGFGNFVMGGSFIIGIIIFIILLLVNFIVITKGSGRIAEVAARFTLDAMPGKQMAIDADLSAGLIDEQQAKTRRQELEQESTFFGAMDGASKFVRGDAIAGLLITFINIIGGLIIGSVEHGLDIGTAANNYVLLTVGDGLVSQIPALIVSVAAGILVSKAGVQGDAGTALVAQMSRHTAGMGVCAGMLFALALLPGIPLIPFAGMGAAMAAGAWYLPKMRDKQKAKEVAELQAAERAQSPGARAEEEPVAKSLAMDDIRLELGYSLLTMMHEDAEQKLTKQIRGLRKQLAQEMGFVLPSVRIQDNLQLPANTYVVRIKEVEAGRGDVRPGKLLVMDPRGDAIALAGEPTREPTFGLAAMWVDQALQDEAMFRGYTVVDCPTVITTHITEIVKDSMPELLSYAETQNLIDQLPAEQKKLVADVVPGQFSLSGIQRVLQNLLAERVSIRDLSTVLEGIAEATQVTRSIQIITEHVRSRLARQLCFANQDPNGQLPLITLGPQWEQAFNDSVIGEGEDKQLAMAPQQLQQFIQLVQQAFEQQARLGQAPVLLTSPNVRPWVRSIIERFRPATVVMSQNEIHPRARIKTLAQI